MAIAAVNIVEQDGGIGTVLPSVAKRQVKMGVCSLGLPNTLYEFADPVSMEAALGVGPLVEAAAHKLRIAGGSVLCVPLNPSTFGSITSSVHTGTGTGTAAVGPTVVTPVTLTIIGGGTVGTATWAYQIGTNPMSAPILTTGGNTLVPGSGGTFYFPVGTYVAGDIYTYNVDSTITHTGTGTVIPGFNGSPADAYNVLITIVTGGAIGTATYTYSLDGGATTSSVYTTNGSQAQVAIPGTGIYFAFVGTFTAGDTYAQKTTPGAATIADLAPAFTALYADPRLWDGVHVVGTPTGSSAALSTAAGFALAAAVDSQMSAAATRYRFVWGLTEGATLLTDGVTPVTDAQILAGLTLSGFASKRLGIAFGDADVLSATAAGKARTYRRNAAWPVSTRVSAIDEWVDPAQVDLGALKDVTRLYRDESVTPGLDDAHLTTLRTWIGEPGYFVGNVRPVSPPTSDFQFIQHRRVMNRAETITRSAAIRFSSKPVRVDPKTGFIDEKDARYFESRVRSALTTALVQPGGVSAVFVTVDRQANILATGAEPIEIGIVPLGYGKLITAKLGFVNPALA